MVYPNVYQRTGIDINSVAEYTSAVSWLLLAEGGIDTTLFKKSSVLRSVFLFKIACKNFYNSIGQVR